MQELHCFLSRSRHHKQLLLAQLPIQPLSVRKTRMGWLVLIDGPSAAKHLS